MRLRILMLAIGCLFLTAPTMVTAKTDKEVVIPLENRLAYDCTPIGLTSYETLAVDYTLDAVDYVGVKVYGLLVTEVDDLYTDADDVGWVSNESLYIENTDKTENYNVPIVIPLNKNLSNTLYKNVTKPDYNLPLLVPLC